MSTDTKSNGLTIESTLPLHHAAQKGQTIPVLGFGLFRTRNGKEATDAVRWALNNGYRHLDTAAIYGNEESVGQALKDVSKTVPRSEIFLTTKLWNADQGYESTLKAFDHSLKLLQTDYVDLYLMHYPVSSTRLESWRAMEEIFMRGKARAIGVSNFTVKHLKHLLANCKVKPSVNQFELSAYFVRSDLVDFCHENDIVVEAYSPLTKGRKLTDAKLVKMAEKYKVSAAQILLRYVLQRNVVCLVKSASEARIKENADLYGFEISAEDMKALNAFDEELVTGWDSRSEP